MSTRSSKRATREGDSDRHPLSTSGRRPQAPSDALPGPAIMIGHPEAPVSFCAPGEIDILADERDTVVSSKRAQVASDLGFGADDDNDDDDDDATSAYDQPMSSSTLYRSTSTRSARSSSRTPEKVTLFFLRVTVIILTLCDFFLILYLFCLSRRTQAPLNLRRRCPHPPQGTA